MKMFSTVALAVTLGLQTICLADSRSASRVRWNEESRRMELLGTRGVPWLVRAFAGVRLTDGTQILSDQQRYTVSRQVSDTTVTLRFDDANRQLDMLWTVKILDDASVTVQLEIVNRNDKPLALDRIVPLTARLVEKHDPSQRHMLLNGFTTSPPHPTLRMANVTSLESYETAALESPPIVVGWLTGCRNFGHVDFRDLNDRPVAIAWGECNGCRLPAGERRASDQLFISTHSHPLAEMERFADLAAEINAAKVWHPRIAWCTWYAGWQRQQMAAYKDGMERGIEQMIPLVKRHFSSRGAKTMRICDDFLDYGDWSDKTKTLPGGFSRLARLIDDAGLTPGVWYAPYWAEAESEVLRDHPEWFARDNRGKIWFETGWQPKSRDTTKFAVFDTTHPEVVDYFEKTARTWRERGFRYVSTDFLQWSLKPDRYWDPTETKAEVLRAGMEAIRRGLGPDVFYRPINNPLGVAMGIANDTRISGDSHGDNPTAYFRTGEVWFYNHRLWLNDPSAIVCARYGKLRDLGWNRMWMSWMALAGTVLTYGEVIDELPEPYLRMYQRIFPNLPVAGRPLDIWENSPYMLWGMAPGEADGCYELFGVFDLKGQGAEHIKLNLDEISARCRSWTEYPEEVPANYLVWDFWNARLLHSRGERLVIDRPQRSGRLFALRADLGRPQLLGTSGHFSCGVIETRDVVWNEADMSLSGRVQGNGGDPTVLYFHMPNGVSLSSVELNGRSGKGTQRGDGDVVSMDVPKAAAPLPFRLSFSGKLPELAPARAFQTGRAAEVAPQRAEKRP